MNFKNFIISTLLFAIILHILFSTTFINNKPICKCKHIIEKNILNIEIPGTYKLFNPSICKFEDGYILCARYSNKIIKNIFLYLYSNVEYRSTICFIILDNDLKIKKTVFPKMKSNFLEDPRITSFNDHLYVSITEFTDKKHIFPSMYIFDKNFILIRKIQYNWDLYYNIKYPNTKRCSIIQKNWCPFQYKNSLFIHTDSYPTWTVFKFEDNIKPMVINIDTSTFFEDLNHKLVRCSTSWVDFSENTFLCGLHTKEFAFKQFLPTIRSVFVEIDKNTFNPIRKTKLLCLDFKNDSRIQFLSGMESDDLNIYIAYGIGDYKCQIKKISKKYINSLLY